MAGMRELVYGNIFDALDKICKEMAIRRDAFDDQACHVSFRIDVFSVLLLIVLMHFVPHGFWKFHSFIFTSFSSKY